MFKIFYSDRHWLNRRLLPQQRPVDIEAEAWRCDPLAHPAIAAMSAEQVADLPSAGLHPRARC